VLALREVTMVTDQNGSAPFDAGGDFGSQAELLASLATGGGEPAPPADDEAPAPEATPDGNEEESAWADKVEDETPKTAKTPSPAAPVLEVKGPKGVKKYDLTPDNAELKRALEYAEGFRPMQAQRDKALQEAKTLKSENGSLREKAVVWDELQSLAQAGHTDRVVRAVLGDQAYAAYRKAVADEETGYASADPAERAAIDKARAEREASYQRTQDSKRIKDLESRLEAQQDQVETDRLRGIGQQALAKFSFRDTVQDGDLAEQLDQELWTSAWSRLEALSDEGHEVTPQLVQKVFAQKAKVLRGGAAKVAEQRVQTIVEGKKQVAKQQAQAAATARYPSQAATPQIEGWNGRSMSDLVRRLAKG
jgi:hypothetical protein